MSFLAEMLSNFVDELREYGLERRVRRYYGDYQGVATSNADPQEQGRTRVSCEVVRGTTGEIGTWAYPITPYAGKDRGFFFPPEEGDPVWVSYDHGKVSAPRVSGSWWTNPNAERTPATSHMPKEFAYVEGKPQRRGIKTRKGLILFDDAAPKVRLASINQAEELTEAQVRHFVDLDSTPDSDEFAAGTFAGHRFRMVDTSGSQKIEATSIAGHFFRIDDTGQKITIETAAKQKIEIDIALSKITLETPGQQRIEVADTPAGITLQDVTGNIIKTSPTGVDVTSALAVNVNAAAAATINAAAAATVNAAGALALTGTGVAVTSAGGGATTQVATGIATSTFAGLKTETFLGGLTQVIVGLLGITATAIEILAPVVSLGAPGPKFALIDTRFLTDPTFGYLTHTHTSSLPGIQTGPPTQSPPINGVSTGSVIAN